MKKQGTFLGIPYDWRWPTRKILKEKFWNKADRRLFTPKVLGWGWGINFYELLRDKRRLFVILVFIVLFFLDALALDDITTNTQPSYSAEYTMLIVSVVIGTGLVVWYKKNRIK
jgi:hypothetical protein